MKKRIRVLIYPIHQFLKLEAVGGFLLVGAALLAMLLANSPVAQGYHALWETPLQVGLGKFIYSQSLHEWINHGLMTLFFLFVGLEIKKEILAGVLDSRKKATLPLIAALGGMVVPALLYLMFNPPGSLGSNGWGIPIATDIAFAIGALMILGNRVPLSLKVFLLALAIFDDLGGILVITMFYSTALVWSHMGIAASLFLLMLLMNARDYRDLVPYIILGICLWLVLLQSGVPATIAGVLTAVTIPTCPFITPQDFYQNSEPLLGDIKHLKTQEINVLNSEPYQAAIQTMEKHCKMALTPLQRLENTLHPWVNFLILPLFALANAGVTLQGGSLASAYQNPVTLGIVIGLCLGKPIGISLFVWLATRLKLAALPNGVKMNQILALGFFGGISFTMGLFFADLSFANTPLLFEAKVGVFSATLLSVLIGIILLGRSLKKQKTA